MHGKIKFIAMMLALGLLIPQHGVIPVQNASQKDWHAQSFWYAPWGKSGVHKGIDIFAKHGTPVQASVSGLVLFTGNIERGGNVIAIMGPKWRIHYYAHLATVNTHGMRLASRGEMIGTVGDSGNATGKPPHLHYSVLSIIPYPWRYSTQTQGWKKVFYINPADGFML